MALNYWRTNCKYAPSNKNAKHCEAVNTGKKAEDKAKAGKIINKGYYGCAKRCNKFEVK